MCKRLSLIVVALLWASCAQAAYTTAKVVVVEKAPTGLHVVVEFSGNAGEPLKQEDLYVNSLADLQQKQFDVKARLNLVSVETGKITVGLIVTDPSGSLPPTPTPEELARQKFFADVAQLAAVKPFIDAGVFSAVKTYTDLLALVQSEFIDSYVNDQGWPRFR